MLDIHFLQVYKKNQKKKQKQCSDWLQGTPVMAALLMNKT